MEGETATAMFRLDIKGNTSTETTARVSSIRLNLNCSDVTTGELWMQIMKASLWL